MKDIKELVTEIALVADGLHVDPKCRDVELCTRFLAAYLAEQEPVAYYCGRNQFGSPVFRVGVLPITEGPLFTAPPLPAIPDHLCLVPREPTEAMILAGNLMQHGVRAAYKAMIAAGEVK